VGVWLAINSLIFEKKGILAFQVATKQIISLTLTSHTQERKVFEESDD